ncbi:acyltransferase family protein [Tersicoccus sp. MR15.9]|uniref:acyltransferase family protein n=1 Tax=Tersicoccus mangrovi TaxID=3121635 RepID=UPI002FE567B7
MERRTLDDGLPVVPATRADREPDRGFDRSDRPGHIGGLDGLRALAVVAVLLYHLSPSLLPGGYLGVDVFFVVSGFLITSLLIRERERTGTLALGRFWLRRARRLLPALAVVVAVSVALGFLVGRDLLVGIGRQTLGALTFSNNWLEIAAGSSYFAHTSPQLFVNFWSLAVEEQFYLLWPFLFLGLVALPVRWSTRAWIAAGAALVSALMMAVLYTPGTDATRVYYGTDTHAFGLLLGVALAFAWAGGRGLDLGRALWRHRRVPISVGSLVLLIGAMTVVASDGAFAYRGGILLTCLITTVLVLTLLEGASPVQRMLDSRPVAWVGERSYGIYLWHWPALVIADALVPTAIGSTGWWTVRILALVVTVVVSALSYRWLEVPIRRHGFRSAGRAVADAVVSGGRSVTAPRVLAGVAGLVVLFAVLGVMTAPAKSAVQATIEQNQSLITDTAPAPRAPASPGAPGASPGAPRATASASPTASVSASATASAAPVPSAPASSPPPGDGGPGLAYPAGQDIIAIGDSLVVTSADGLKDRFPGLAFDARSNRQWPDGVAAVDARLAAGTMPRAVILHFGTNAGVPDPGVVRQVLDKLGPDRMVVLVNLYGASSFVPEANRAYADLVQGRRNVIVADWNRAIAGRVDLLQPDQIHPGILGAHLYADTIKQAFHDLAVRTGGAVPADWAIRKDY